MICWVVGCVLIRLVSLQTHTHPLPYRVTHTQLYAQDIQSWKTAFGSLQDAKDTYNVVMLDTRIVNPDSTNTADIETLKAAVDPCVMMGRKYEMAVEELTMCRKDHAGLRREKKESEMWKKVRSLFSQYMRLSHLLHHFRNTH